MAKVKSLAIRGVLVSLLLCTSCSARSINPKFASEFGRSTLDSFGYGFGSLAAGATAPLTCGVYYLAYPFQHLEGQGGIGVLFTPFTALFGMLVGTARAIPMVCLGIVDVASLGFADLSAEYFYSYNGFGQWCACMHAKCVELEKVIIPIGEEPSLTPSPTPTIK